MDIGPLAFRVSKDFLLSRHPAARHDAISRLNGGRHGSKPPCEQLEREHELFRFER
jgi:hypothetical protein